MEDGDSCQRKNKGDRRRSEYIGNMVNTAALSAIKERITADSLSIQNQQRDKNVIEKSRDNKRSKDRLKVSMRHFQSAIEKVNRKSKTSSAP